MKDFDCVRKFICLYIVVATECVTQPFFFCISNSLQAAIAMKIYMYKLETISHMGFE